jgi:hypothetical protein
MATIETTKYNKTAKTLELVFGYDVEKVYTFKNVPAKTAKAMDEAESKGKFYHANIKGKFEFEWNYAE